MAAELLLSDDTPSVGDEVLISGQGFLPEVALTLTAIGPDGNTLTADFTTDPAGDFAVTDAPDKATATLTSDATNVTANDTVTIGAVTYTFKAAPTTVANEVKIGATAADTLANLKKAINLTGVAGTDYGSLTVIHPTVEAGVITATTLKLAAKTGGTAGNALVSTEASTHLSFGDTTFVDTGAAAVAGSEQFKLFVGKVGTWTITGTDGTNTARKRFSVWSRG